MTMCNRYLQTLYRAFVERTHVQSEFIEHWMQLRRINRSVDEERNEQSIYTDLFSDQCRSEIEDCYLEALAQIRGHTFAESEDVLNALLFLQEVIAAAMWKHRCEVGSTLETFARRFDRLETPIERRRLHAEAQEM